jgi:hypothetical protein
MSKEQRNTYYRRLIGKSLDQLSQEAQMPLEGVRSLLRQIGLIPPKYPKQLRQCLSNIQCRCNSPTDRKYRFYGGKGIKAKITIEELFILWKRDKADKLNHPSIDRIDPSKDYTLANCRFIEHQENRMNRWKTEKEVMVT